MGSQGQPRLTTEKASRQDPATATASNRTLDRILGEVLRALNRALRRHFPRAPEDLVMTAAEDAILEHLANPVSFDRARGVPIEKFLRLPARRNLINLLRNEERRRFREREYSRLRETATYDSAADVLERRENVRMLRRAVMQVSHPSERDALRRWLVGEHATHEIANALQVSSLAVAEQRRVTKRLKDRVLKRVWRFLLGPITIDACSRREASYNARCRRNCRTPPIPGDMKSEPDGRRNGSAETRQAIPSTERRR